MKIRVTQTDIARVAGVHNTTVSLALRNSRLIPATTRERIHAIARSMGYTPDPALRALAAYRNARRERRQTVALAYVTNWESKWGWSNLPAHKMHYAGARRKAAELGYQIEHLWLGEPGMTQRRLDTMLLHRGITGVLLASHRMSCDELSEISWPRLAAVKIGCFPHSPALNQFNVDHCGTVRVAVRRILAAGYRRIGLLIPQSWDKLADQSWSAAFLAEQFRSRVRDALPVQYLHDSPQELPADNTEPDCPPESVESMLRWYRKYRPEVILGLGPASLAHVRRGGLRVPADVAYADLFLQDADGTVAGVQEQCEKVGELAVEMVANQLQQNVLGLPAIATTTSVSGLWSYGATLPSRKLATLDDDEIVEAPLGGNLVA